MTYSSFELPPNPRKLTDDQIFVVVASYIQDNIDNKIFGALETADLKCENAEGLMSGLVQSFKDAHMMPRRINATLERIANSPLHPYYIVDAAIRCQDQLIEKTFHLRDERDKLQAEYIEGGCIKANSLFKREYQ